MGNYCSRCGVRVNSGDYCDRCFERVFPSCSYCKAPLRANQVTIGNYHKFPCYSQYSRKCCECNAPAVKGSYCQDCYDVRYPPPPKLHVKHRDGEVTWYSRNDDVIPMLQSLAYAHGRGMAAGEQQRYYLQ